MLSKTRRLALAAVLAASFLVFRLIYAFVFNGLGGSQLLLELPEYRLTGPFRQIVLLGDVTVDGIVRNLEVATPFAFSILAFGALAALLDAAKLAWLGRRFASFSWLSTALGVSLATIPALARAIGDISRSQRLRAESKFAIMVPLLERTLGSATAMALELARSKPADTAAASLRLRNFRAGHLAEFSAEFSPGDVVLLTGSTGSGKTTLLRAIAGELFEAEKRRVSGDIKLGPLKLANFKVASGVSYLVPQLPNAARLPEQIIQGVFSRGIDQSGAAGYSHGEAYRITLDVALARRPRILLLDEPSAALDEAGLDLLIGQVAEIAQAGGIVFIAEHRTEAWVSMASRKLQIRDGAVLEGAYEPVVPEIRRNPKVVGQELTVQIEISELVRSRTLLSGVELELRQSECLGITGPNGSGKSSLLRQIAWPQAHQLRIHGKSVAGPEPKRVALVPDNPSDFFVCASLGEELRRADRIAHSEPGLTQLTFESILGHSVSSEFETHPLDLSVGTQLALATAMQLSHKPALVLLDEPVQGLDPAAKKLLAETIRCIQETGCAVVFATHDLEFAAKLANSIMKIEDLRLVPVAKLEVR